MNIHDALVKFPKIKVEDVLINTILEDHSLDINITTPEDYYSHASNSGIWLNNSEMSAYLLTRGFILNSGNPTEIGTDIEYINQAGQRIYFHNNGVEDKGADISSGTHWMAATLSTNSVNLSELNDGELTLDESQTNKKKQEINRLQTRGNVANVFYTGKTGKKHKTVKGSPLQRTDGDRVI